MEPVEGQISCSMASTLVRRLRGTLGESAVEELLSRAGVGYVPAFLEDAANWIWYHEAVALLDAAAAMTGDPDVGRRVGEEAVRRHAGTPVATLPRSLGSPEAIFAQLATAVTKFSTVTEMETLEVAPGRARGAQAHPPRVRAAPSDVRLRPRHALAAAGAVGLPAAAVEETR